MQNIDFTKLAKKYPLLQSKDISFLNNFFNREDIQSVLEEIEKERKKIIFFRKICIILIIIWIILGIIFSILYMDIESIGSGTLFVHLIVWSMLWVIIPWIIIVVATVYLKFFSKNKKTIKDNILPEFIKSINNKIKYSKDWKYFKDSFSKLTSAWFLKNYSRIDYIEDSIEYLIWEKEKSIEITWCELKTSEKRTRRTKNWTSTYYVVTNHCYLMKIDFKNPKYILEKSIKLMEDISNNYKKKFLKVLIIEISIVAIFLNWISGWENSDGYIKEFMELAFNYWIISIVFLIWMFFVIWFIYWYVRWKKRVILENIDFEKEFDVFSEDWIETRKILTPSFMYKIVDFVNKINNKRVYEMYLHKNFFYIKYKLNNIKWNVNYMEFSKHKSVFQNLEDYVEFYLEIKNISSLSKDLKLFYYDKGMMTKELIK